MIFSENRSPLFRIMPFLIGHDLFGKPVPTFPDHALLRTLIFVFGAGNQVGAGKPAIEIDVAASFGAERAGRGVSGLAADRAGPRRTATLSVTLATTFLASGAAARLRRARH